MTVTVTVTWASEEDKIGGNDFVKERRAKITEMVSANKTDGVVNTQPNDPVASMTFVDQAAAEEWSSFVQALALKYNKSIINVQIQ